MEWASSGSIHRIERKRMRKTFIVVLLLPGAIGLALAEAPLPEPAQPDPPAEDRVASLESKLADMKRVYDARIAALEAEIAALKGAQGTNAPGPATAPPPVPPVLLPAAAPSQTSNYFNPSVSVIGNFLGVGGSNRTETLKATELRESELGLQAVVEPYARADFFL